MIDDETIIYNSSHWQNAESPWRNFEKIKYLKGLLRAMEKELSELKNDPVVNKELIDRENTFLEIVQKEIRRLEKKCLHTELGGACNNI